MEMPPLLNSLLIRDGRQIRRNQMRLGAKLTALARLEAVPKKEEAVSETWPLSERRSAEQ
jgi:hypothetical protein